MMTDLTGLMTAGTAPPGATAEMHALWNLMACVGDPEAVQGRIADLAEATGAHDDARAASEQSAAKAREAWSTADERGNEASDREATAKEAERQAGAERKTATDAAAAECKGLDEKERLFVIRVREFEAQAEKAKESAAVKLVEAARYSDSAIEEHSAAMDKLAKAKTLMSEAKAMKADYEGKFAELGAIVSRKAKGT